MYYPRKAVLVFFFFLEVLEKLRQLSTRCSRVSVKKRQSITSEKRKSIDGGRSSVPSQVLSSSAFLFLCATSSSFFLASNPSLARFIFTALIRKKEAFSTGVECMTLTTATYFLLLTSSSINNCLDWALSLTLKEGSRP